jgi:Fe-S cluster assembly iron-binding protein IscA
MLKVTDKAREELKKLLFSSTRDAETCLRLAYGALGQFGLVLGREKDGDEVVNSHGLKVLLVGHEFVSLLDGVTLDVANGRSQRQFFMTKGVSR